MRNPNGKNDPDKLTPDPEERTLLARLWPTLIWILLTFLAITWFWNQFGAAAETAQIEYSVFRGQVQDGNVARVTVQGEELTGEFDQAISTMPLGVDEPQEVTEFLTYLPSFGDEALLSMLEANDVVLETRPQAEFSLLPLLLNLLPFVFLGLLAYYFLRRMGRQGQNVFSMGQNRARLYSTEREKTTFDDVAGLKGAKEELLEIVAYLKDPTQVQSLGGQAPKGVLLVGPPGTGKTLLARAVAGEADVPFFSITGSDFMEMFVGVGASRVRGMFEDARKVAPCILFIDELDSIGRRRGAGLGGGHDEREQTLNQLLSELDGFEPSENIVVMAATNRPDILDPALLRPGRFDRQITVDLPTLSARKEILRIHAANKPLEADVDLERLARATPGFSGADLENLLNEAALLAARRQQKAISWDDIEEARDKVMMGLVREGLALTDQELRLIAHHEAGHAVVAALLDHAEPVHKVTIVPRGKAMGVTQQLPEREKYIYPREYLLDRLAVMMGGRAAENLIFSTATSGAENDLKQATRLARKMVLDWGMSQRLGPVALGGRREQVFLGEEIAQRREYSEETARQVDEEIQSILETAFQRAAETIEAHKEGYDQVVEALLDREEILGDQIEEILGLGHARPALAG